MTRKVIVTGGCGYIGSHVARAFKFEGDRVFVIDRVKRDHTLKNIDGWLVEDFASVDALSFMVMEEPDIIVHCAGTSLVGPSNTDPGEYYNNNIAKFVQLLNVVKSMRKKPVIMFSSSASVYGEPRQLPIPEDTVPDPISVYGRTKLMSEQILKDYARAYGIDSICFRYFNAAGAMPVTHDLGQETGATHIVARVLEANLRGEPFTVNGTDFDTPDGTCIRDYVHVWDIATAHIRGAEFISRHRKIDDIAGSHIFNLGTNKGISNQDIVDYVTATYGLSTVLYKDRRDGDPAVLVADAQAADTWLGWKPKHSDMRTIINSAYQWYCGQNIHS